MSAFADDLIGASHRVLAATRSEQRDATWAMAAAILAAVMHIAERDAEAKELAEERAEAFRKTAALEHKRLEVEITILEKQLFRTENPQ